jgi:hypothetical protein
MVLKAEPLIVFDSFFQCFSVDFCADSVQVLFTFSDVFIAQFSAVFRFHFDDFVPEILIVISQTARFSHRQFAGLFHAIDFGLQNFMALRYRVTAPFGFG